MNLDEVNEVIYTRRKTIAVLVGPGGWVVVRAPLRTSRARIQVFLRSKAEWIAAARQKMAAVPVPGEAVKFVEGEKIPYLGMPHPLRFATRVRGGLVFEPKEGFILQADRQDEANKLLKKFYQAETRRLVSEWVDHYQRPGMVPTAIRVTSARTRWGSCSGKNGLSFSYRLAMVPVEVIGYVVAHEMAHIRQHNHSKACWSVVEELRPGYRKERAWLKAHGAELPLL